MGRELESPAALPVLKTGGEGEEKIAILVLPSGAAWPAQVHKPVHSVAGRLLGVDQPGLPLGQAVTDQARYEFRHGVLV